MREQTEENTVEMGIEDSVRWNCFWYHEEYCCHGLSPAFIDPEDLWFPERFAHGRCPCDNNPDATDCLYAEKIGALKRLTP